MIIINLLVQLFSVIIVPPNAEKCPCVCLNAALNKFSKPVNHVSGTNQKRQPTVIEMKRRAVLLI